MNADALLEFFRSRATVRAFEDRPVPREVLERLVEAARRAPSPTNRQPWRFSVVTAKEPRQAIARATHEAIATLRALIAKGPHPDHLGDYWNYFVKPMESAPAFIVVQYRRHADNLAMLIEDAGGDRKAFCTPDDWDSELSAASAATMLLLLQAHAEGLGACWMSGPMLARDEICRLLRIPSPWRMLGGIALGWPAERPAPTTRRPLAKAVEWFED